MDQEFITFIADIITEDPCILNERWSSIESPEETPAIRITNKSIKPKRKRKYNRPGVFTKHELTSENGIQIALDVIRKIDDNIATITKYESIIEDKAIERQAKLSIK